MANILVADDEDYIRDKIKRALEENNHNVEEAKDGKETIELIKQKSFDLLLLDIHMPNKGGIETIMELKGNMNKTKIIIVSGKAPTDSIAFDNLVKQFGAYKVLHKPFRKKELIDSVNEVL